MTAHLACAGHTRLTTTCPPLLESDKHSSSDEQEPSAGMYMEESEDSSVSEGLPGDLQ